MRKILATALGGLALGTGAPGSTVRGTDFFADAAPPLKSVPCDFCREARLYRWQAEISRTDFQQALAPWLKEKGQAHSVVKTVSLTRETAGQTGYPEFDLRDGRQTLDVPPMLIDQGEADPFLETQLQTQRLEVFAAGRVFRLDNFRKLQAWGVPGFATHRRFSQNKGQVACCKAFLQTVANGGPAPISVEELFEVQRWLLQAVQA